MYSTLTRNLGPQIRALALTSSIYLLVPPAVADAVHPTRVSPAAAEVVHPIKIAGNDPAAQATPDVHTDPTYKWRVMGHSADKLFRAGLSWTAKGVNDVDEPNAVDEFLFIVKGREKYTSLDGTVIEVNAGEGIFVPKGWRGKWESDGPVEFFFAVYDPGKLYEQKSRQ